jgi:hypothetical protein
MKFGWGASFFIVSMKACMTKRKSIGDILPPCCTPVVYSMELFLLLCLNLTRQFGYSFSIT